MNEEKTKELAKKALEKKWSQIDDEYLELYSSCEFCFHCSWNCQICLCPNLICSERGEAGLLKYIKNQYGDNLKIKDFYTKLEYNLMIECLNDLIQMGKLGEKTENNVKNLIY